MTKRLYPINFKLEGSLSNYDADHLGHLICNLIKNLDPSIEVLNIIKLEVTNISRESLQKMCKALSDAIRESNISNFIIIPLGYGVDNVKVELIKVEERSFIEEIFDRIRQNKKEWSQGFIDDFTFAQRLNDLEFEYLGKYE